MGHCTAPLSRSLCVLAKRDASQLVAAIKFEAGGMKAPQLGVDALERVDARVRRASRIRRSRRVGRRGGAALRRRRDSQPHKGERQRALRHGEVALHVGERGLSNAPTAHADDDVAGLDAPGRGARGRDGGDDGGVEQTLRVAQAQPDDVGAKVDVEVAIRW